MLQILKTYKVYLTFLIILTLAVKMVAAQDIIVNAKIDTSEFLIGDQVGLKLQVTQPKNEFVGIPFFDEEVTKQIEILEQSENDTTILESGDLLVEKQLLITAFDSGYYALPPIPFLYNADTLLTEPVLFKVNTVPVDTSQAIKDIKLPYGAPLSFAEVMPWVGSGLGLAIIILIAVYIIRKLKRKEPIIGRVKPRQPAHVIALRDLSRLKDDKLWQKDKIKIYYTILTDILRVYLWNRYSIRTLERTSEEILESLKLSDFKDDNAYNNLKEIFYTSDLVKFAKFKPLADEHIKCMDGAYSFVNKTKLIVEEIEPKPARLSADKAGQAGGEEKADQNKLVEADKKVKIEMLEEQNN